MSAPVSPEPSFSVPPRAFTSGVRAVTRFLTLQYFKTEYRDRHHIPSRGPALVIPNHPTYVDPWLVGYGTKRLITWLAWDEAFAWPLVGPFIANLGAIPLNLERADGTSLRAAYSVLRAGQLLGVFFEGARTAAGNFQINDPLPGAARLALRTGAPVVPVSVSGARRLWPRDDLVPKRGKVVVTYHPPVDPEAVGRGSQRRRAELLTGRVAEAVRSALPLDGGVS
ncbi:MAG: lysophospholipid acyltransferase family protein [Planctomycetota bacterium]